MIPPTPTALPPGIEIVTIPEGYSLWASAPSAVQSWNMLGDGRTIVQAVFLLALIVIAMFLLQRFASRFSRQDAEQ